MTELEPEQVGKELLGIAHMIAALLTQTQRRGDIDFDDLWGAAALGAWKAQLAKKPGYNEKQNRAFVAGGARLAALSYIRRETKMGRDFRPRPVPDSYLEEKHDRGCSGGAYALVLRREIFESALLTELEKEWLIRAEEGCFTAQWGGFLAEARRKIRENQF